MSWTGIVSGLIQAATLVAGWAREAGLRREGTRRAELEALRQRQSVQRKADEIDDRPLPDRDSDVLGRL